jgi:hypothetical protein
VGGYGGCSCGSPGGYAGVAGADDDLPGAWALSKGGAGSGYGSYRTCPTCRARGRRDKRRILMRLLLWVIPSAISSLWAWHVASGIPDVMTTNGRPEEIGWWLIFSLVSLLCSLICFAMVGLSRS